MTDPIEKAEAAIREAMASSEAPDHGVAAAKAITQYSNAAIEYVIRTGQSILRDAEAFNSSCEHLASEIQRATATKCAEVLDITTRLREAAFGLQTISRQFKEPRNASNTSAAQSGTTREDTQSVGGGVDAVGDSGAVWDREENGRGGPAPGSSGQRPPRLRSHWTTDISGNGGLPSGASEPEERDLSSAPTSGEVPKFLKGTPGPRVESGD